MSIFDFTQLMILFVVLFLTLYLLLGFANYTTNDDFFYDRIGLSKLVFPRQLAGLLLSIFLAIAVCSSFACFLSWADQTSAKQNCKEFSEQTGYETKFETYSSFSHDCFAKVNGSWAVSSNVYIDINN